MEARFGLAGGLGGKEKIEGRKGKMYHSFVKANPGIGFTWLVNILIQVFSTVMPVVTPSLKKELEDFLKGLYKKAEETPNPWDDFLVKFLLRMMNMVIPEQ
jgi:hypothetical protein